MNIKEVISLLATTSSAAMLYAQQQPNILWLTYEDTSPQFIGCYGNDDAKTPNIDSLTTDGVTFNAAFSTGAVSSPSRFCLITGVKAFSSGNGNHRSQYPIESGWEGFPFYLRQEGYYTSNNSKTDYNIAQEEVFNKRAWDESSAKASWWGRKKGQPFFAVYNSISSHQSRTMTQSYEWYEKSVLDALDKDERTENVELEMPPFYRDSPQMQKNLSRVYNSVTLTDKEFGRWLTMLDSDNLRDSTIIFCFSDHGEGIPRGKCAPLSMGYRVAFTVWIPPMYSHLSPYGSGIFTDDVVSFEDFAPTVLSIAGIKQPEHMSGKPFLGKFRSEDRRKYAFSGVDRTDENSELSRSVSDGRYMYTRCFMTYQPLVRWHVYHDISDIQKQMRKDFAEGKLNDLQSSILQPKSIEYLYDIKNDKWESVNLIDDPSYIEVADRLRRVLRDNIIAEKDIHFIPERYIKEGAKEGKTPFSMRNDTTLFPVNRVIDAAYLTDYGSDINKQLSLLNDNNEAVRYWAAIALFSRKEIEPHYYKEIVKSRNRIDRNMISRCYITALLVRDFKDTSARNELHELIKSNDEELSSLSLQLLMSMSEREHIMAMPIIKTIDIKSAPYLQREWLQLFMYRYSGHNLFL